MVFFQIAIDCHDPATLVRFWSEALGYIPVPPTEPDTPWHRHYRGRLNGAEAFENRLFDPEGVRPPICFHQVPEDKAGKNRLHLDLYPTARDNSLTQERYIEIVEARVGELVALGAVVQRRDRDDDPEDPYYYVVCHDPEGNEFCVS